MVLFAERIAKSSESTIYHIRHNGSGDIDMFSYLLAVPKHKQSSFDSAMAAGGDVRLEHHGHVLYYGAGALSAARIEEILRHSA